MQTVLRSEEVFSLSRAKDPGLKSASRFPGALSYASRTSAELHFTAAGFGRDFGDAELAALTALGAELAWLDVSRTSITDQAAPVFSGFPKAQGVAGRICRNRRRYGASARHAA